MHRRLAWRLDTEDIGCCIGWEVLGEVLLLDGRCVGVHGRRSGVSLSRACLGTKTAGKHVCACGAFVILKTEERETKIDEQHRTYGVG